VDPKKFPPDVAEQTLDRVETRAEGEAVARGETQNRSGTYDGDAKPSAVPAVNDAIDNNDVSILAFLN